MNTRPPAGVLGLMVAIAVGLPATACESTARSTKHPPHFAVPALSCTGGRATEGSGTKAGGGEGGGGKGGHTRLRDDFNGDGYSDVAFPGGDVTAVMYGSPNGLRLSSKQVFTQGAQGMSPRASVDRFVPLHSADLDRDGYADLVGRGGEDPMSLSVVWGGPHGLSGGAALLGGPVGDDSRSDGPDRLAVTGDFNGDGAPDVGTVIRGKDLRILSGPFDRHGKPAGGVRDIRDPDYHGTPSGWEDGLQDMAAGDVNGDGITDVVTVGRAGSTTPHSVESDFLSRVTYWKGTHKGLAQGVKITKPDGSDLDAGKAVAVGDVNGDHRDDVVVGRSYDGGRITYLPGGANGPDPTGLEKFTQESPGVPGVSQDFDNGGFGTGVSVGDVNGDGCADVATGVPDMPLPVSGDKTDWAGGVIMMWGTTHGLTGKGAQVLQEDTPGVPGTARGLEEFGQMTKLVDTDGDSKAELLAGAPGAGRSLSREDPVFAGKIWVIRPTAHGMDPKGTFVIGEKDLGTSTEGLGTWFSR